jgi:hypothetical protein
VLVVVGVEPYRLALAERLDLRPVLIHRGAASLSQSALPEEGNDAPVWRLDDLVDADLEGVSNVHHFRQEAAKTPRLHISHPRRTISTFSRRFSDIARPVSRLRGHLTAWPIAAGS